MTGYFDGYIDALKWVQNNVVDKMEDREEQYFVWDTIQHRIDEYPKWM